MKTIQRLGWRLFPLLTLVFLGILVFANYLELKLPLVSAKTDQQIAVLIGSTPFVPKTNRQILSTAFFKNSKITSYKAAGQIVIETQNSESILTLGLKGAFQKEGQTNNYKLDFDGDFGPVGLSEPLKAETSEKGKNFFFTVTSFPNVLGLSLNKIYGQITQIDIGTVEKNLNLETRSDPEIQNDIRSFWKSSLGVEKQVNFFKEFEREEKEDFYLFKLNLDKQKIDGIFEKDMKTKTLALSLSVEKSTGYLSALDLVLDGVSDQDLLSLDNSRIKIKANLSSINKVEVETPKEAKKFESIYSLVESVEGKQKDLLAATRKSVDLGGNLLTVERLIHVILLSPLTF
jgi:hypothetical protein